MYLLSCFCRKDSKFVRLKLRFCKYIQGMEGLSIIYLVNQALRFTLAAPTLLTASNPPAHRGHSRAPSSGGKWFISLLPDCRVREARAISLLRTATRLCISRYLGQAHLLKWTHKNAIILYPFRHGDNCSWLYQILVLFNSCFSGSLFKTRCTSCGIVAENYKSPICPALSGKG